MVRVFKGLCRKGQKPAPTKFKKENWVKILGNSDDPWHKIILDGIISGFKLGINPNNMPELNTKPVVYSLDLDAKIAIVSILIDDIKKGYMIPCARKDIKYIAPFFTVEKQDSKTGHRIVKDFAFSDGYIPSLNDCIPSEHTRVEYPTTRNVVSKADRNNCVARMDLKSWYRQLQLHPSIRKYFGHYFEGEYLYDTRIPFGLSSACLYAQKTSETILDIAKLRFIDPNKDLSVYVDDFMLFEMTLKAGNILVRDMLRTYDWLGVVVSHHKTLKPATKSVLLGFEYDLIAKEISITEKRINKYTNEIDILLNKCNFISNKCQNKVSYAEVESLIGKLQWTAIILWPGKAFLNRIRKPLITYNRGQSFYLKNNNIKDLNWWKYYYKMLVGLPFSVVLGTFIRIKGVLRTDASNWGIGCIWGSHWISMAFNDKLFNEDIASKEIYAIFVAFEAWKGYFSGKEVHLRVDSKHARAALIHKKDRKPLRMDMIRALCMIAMKYRIYFYVEWIPSRDNKCADLLSRNQVEICKLYSDVNLGLLLDDNCYINKLPDIPLY